MKSSKPPAKARVVIVETLYHALTGRPPTAHSKRFTRQLSSDEMPYCRELRVERDWVPLDLGWLKEPGFSMVQVSVDEETEVAIRLELAESEHMVRFAIIPKGESNRLTPPHGSQLFLRGKSGVEKFIVRTVVVPR